MKNLAILAFLVCFSAQLHANNPKEDTTYWKSKYESALGFSQTTFTNWVKGGENSISSNLIPVSYTHLDVYKRQTNRSQNP